MPGLPTSPQVWQGFPSRNLISPSLLNSPVAPTVPSQMPPSASRWVSTPDLGHFSASFLSYSCVSVARLSPVSSAHTLHPPGPVTCSALLPAQMSPTSVSSSVRKGERLSNQQIMALALLLLGFQNPAWSSHLIPELPMCKLTIVRRREGEHAYEPAL